MKKSLFLPLAIVLLIGSNAYGQASCAAAFNMGADIDMAGVCLTGTSDDGTIQPGWTGNQCGANVLGEVWATFTITDGSTPNLLFEVDNTSSGGPGGRPFGFQVFSGPCAGLTLLDCDNDAIDGDLETETLTNLPNGTYYVRLIAYVANNFDWSICITQVPDAPANDDCINAIPVAVGANGVCTEVTGTNTGATDSSLPDPSCAFYSGGDVWYSITVPASGNVTFASDYAASNSLDDVGMAIYTGTCGSLTEVDCDDASGNGFMASISATGLTPGTTVYVRVWQDFGGLEGNFDLCFSEPAPPSSNQDCVDSEGLCTDATLNGASDGAGVIVDLDASNQGCLASGENEVAWYNLEISTAGNFAFTLSPDNGSDDYDFAIWVFPGGVGQGCPPNVQPNRCSYGAGAGLNSSYDTGLGQGAVDTSEDAGGDNWVSTIPVAVGDVIVMVIDNFSTTTSPFTLDFTGTAGLDCSVLPVELLTFYAEPKERGNRLHWKTASEVNNDYFTLQYSTDGVHWQTVATLDGQGTTNEMNTYWYDHSELAEGTIYYKLFQTDFDGHTSTPKIISIDSSGMKRQLVKTVNTIGQEVNNGYHGIVIDMYSDGTSKKRFQ